MVTKQFTTILTADGFECRKAFKSYSGFEFSAVETVCESTILTGSVTSVSIQIDDVTVEDYKSGFQETLGQDFQEISFD